MIIFYKIGNPKALSVGQQQEKPRFLVILAFILAEIFKISSVYLEIFGVGSFILNECEDFENT